MVSVLNECKCWKLISTFFCTLTIIYMIRNLRITSLNIKINFLKDSPSIEFLSKIGSEVFKSSSKYMRMRRQKMEDTDEMNFEALCQIDTSETNIYK